jgi:hypothetical protein
MPKFWGPRAVPEMLTIKQVAELLQMTPNGVRQNRMLRAITRTIGERSLRIPRGEMEQLLGVKIVLRADGQLDIGREEVPMLIPPDTGLTVISAAAVV